MRCKALIISILLPILMAACSPANDTPDGTPLPVTLRPFYTSTPSMTPTRLPTLLPGSAVKPTPTPFIYMVVENDTLIGIASRFNVELEQLLAANPGLQPQTLAVGTQLTIPVGPVEEAIDPTPTPVPVLLNAPTCYPTASSGLWCFILVENPYADVLENLSARIALLDNNGKEVYSQEALPPLNILPPGNQIALATYFLGGDYDNLRPAANLLTAIRLLPTDRRYLPAVLNNIQVGVDWSGRTAVVSGQILLAQDSEAANLVWVAAVALDEFGNVVGIRRWDSETALEPGGSLAFNFQVSSLGPSIEKVNLQVEARP